MIIDNITTEQIEKLLDALCFYADPDTYFAIMIMTDPPCGEFSEDFEEIDEGYRPGKLARKVLRDIGYAG